MKLIEGQAKGHSTKRQLDRWLDDEQQAEWYKSDHTCESCAIVTDDGEYAASLGGIWDADTDYRRLIEAELLLEAIPFNSTGMWLFSQ